MAGNGDLANQCELPILGIPGTVESVWWFGRAWDLAQALCPYYYGQTARIRRVHAKPKLTYKLILIFEYSFYSASGGSVFILKSNQIGFIHFQEVNDVSNLQKLKREEWRKDHANKSCTTRRPFWQAIPPPPPQFYVGGRCQLPRYRTAGEASAKAKIFYRNRINDYTIIRSRRRTKI